MLSALTKSTTALALLTLLAAACGPDAGGPVSAPDADADARPIVDAASTDSDFVDARDASIDSATTDATAPADSGDGESDAGNGCTWSGAPGRCISVSACAALSDHTPYSGACPGPANIECCIKTPSTTDNPPVPAGHHLMQQSQVTPEMTTWAVSILNDPATYPMFSTTTKTFGTLAVLARVEWHAPDFQNGVVHRGVTLYVQ